MKKIDVTLLRSDWRLIGYRAIHTAVVLDQNIHNNIFLLNKNSEFGNTFMKRFLSASLQRLRFKYWVSSEDSFAPMIVTCVFVDQQYAVLCSTSQQSLGSPTAAGDRSSRIVGR